MKSISKSVIIALLFLAVNYTNAQSYQLLPDSNASWLVQDRSSEYTNYTRYFLNDTPDDTLVNGQTYTKIFSESQSPYYYYKGAFRNDASGKIFFMPNGETPQFPQEERILQDFTKVAGDTVFDVAVHNGDYMGSYDFVVDSVRYYPCGPYTLKSVSLHTIEEIPQIGNFMLLHWIEKIGSTWGGVFNQANHTLNNFTLVCHNASDTIFYTAPVLGYLPSPEYLVYRSGSCEFYLPTAELVESGEFSIFPNPCSDYFTISTANNYSDIDLSIFDVMGRLVLTKNISVLTNKHKIDFPSLSPKGSYVVVLKNRNKVLWKQVISKK